MSHSVPPSNGRPLLEPLEARLLLDATLPGQNEVDPAVEAQVVQFFEASPAVFVENQGQWVDESVRYLFQRPGAGIAFTDGGPVFHLYSAIQDHPGAGDVPGPMEPTQPAEYETTTFRTFFEGANTVTPVGLDVVETSFNYFVGDQSMHRSDVPGYSTIAYFGIYQGIDLYLYGSQSNLKYEFHVAPGADWSEVIVSYDGIEGLTIDPEGNLHVQTSLGELIEDAPYIYQEIDGEQVAVVGAFELFDSDTYGFRVSGPYDPMQILILDPDLLWATYLGGEMSDWGHGIDLDSAGNIYITGITDSTGLATPGSYDETYGGEWWWGDAFVAKLSADGSSLLYCTYLGGPESDQGRDIVVDGSGSAYVTGSTVCAGMATSGAYDETLNGDHDIFVAKLNSAGTGLDCLTYLGGEEWDVGRGITLDASGNVYVTGHTESVGWATSGAYDETHNGDFDVFVAKLSPALNALEFCTYLGGLRWDAGTDIAVDGMGMACVTGDTDSSGWATEGAHDETFGGREDVFVAKVNAAGTGLVYCTYLGGIGTDEGEGIAVDSAGNAYVTGATSSGGWATPGAYDTSISFGNDVFVAKLNGNGADLVYCTYLGDYNPERGYGIQVDYSGNAYVTGYTSSPGLATPWAYDDTYNGGGDIFVAKFNAGGTDLAYFTYLGGTEKDIGGGIALGPSGIVAIMGYTKSSGWATSGAYDTTYNGDGEFHDVFVATIRVKSQGDANGDGKVDGGDLAIWQQNYDPLGINQNTFAMGDWNGDTKIDGGDLALWQQNYDPIGPVGGGAAQLMMSVVGGPSVEQTPLVSAEAGVSALVPISDIDETSETTAAAMTDALTAAAPVNVGGQVRKRDRLNDPQAHGYGRHAYGRHLARRLRAETDAIDLLAIPGLRLPV